MTRKELAILCRRPDLREQHTREVSLAKRIIELVPASLADYAEHFEARSVQAATICGACAVCCMPLTDPVSLARGIGPECWKLRRACATLAVGS